MKWRRQFIWWCVVYIRKKFIDDDDDMYPLQSKAEFSSRDLFLRSVKPIE